MAGNRYRKLTDYYPINWIPAAPVEIIQGAIHLDQIDRRVVLQLKLCNISNQDLFSVHIQVKCYDETGEALTEDNIVHFAYQDLHMAPRDTFGDQTPIYLPDVRVRKVDVSINNVMFSSGDTTVVNEASAQRYPALTPIEGLGSELVQELRRIWPGSSSVRMETIPQLLSDSIWACTCGRPNEIQVSHCVRCGRSRDWQLEKVNVEFLQQSLREHTHKLEEQDKLRALEESKRIRSKKKRRRKVIWFASSGMIFIALSITGYKYAEPSIQYASANQMLKSGEYDEAKLIFTALGEYKDSELLIQEADYLKALDIREKGDISQSVMILKKIEHYRDSSDQLLKSRYLLALDLMKQGKYQDAGLLFIKLDNYQDSKEQLSESYYQFAQAAIESSDYQSALKTLEKIPEYKDSKVQMNECRYQIALSLYSNENISRDELKQAQKLFKELGDYKDSLEKNKDISTALTWHGRWYRLRYEQWAGSRKDFDKTYGKYGDNPFEEYVDINYFDEKLISYSKVVTTEYRFTISAHTLITDSYYNDKKYVLQGGDRLILESKREGSRYKITYIREDVKDEAKP